MSGFGSIAAVILAAGSGRRLGPESEHHPKVLLRFGGRSLLERHIEILESFGVFDITVVVGHLASAIEDEIRRLGARARIRTIENPRYREGSVVSLWQARDVLADGGPILLMDGDVLYDARLMAALIEGEPENCLLLDRNIEPGEEPVKLCIRDGEIVDFHKRPSIAHEWHGESVGFFRLSPAVAAELARRSGAYIAAGRHHLEYEEPLRDLIIEAPQGRFGYVEITGLPWLEIDFARDVERARREVLDRLKEAVPAGEVAP